MDTGEARIESLALKLAIDSLEQKEKYILNERYYKGKTQSEVAKVLGVSQVQISRKEKQILNKLRTAIE